MNASDEYKSKCTCIIGQGSRNWKLEDSGNKCNGYAISPAEGVLYNARTFLSNLMSIFLLVPAVHLLYAKTWHAKIVQNCSCYVTRLI